jgi:hypothetical protein
MFAVKHIQLSGHEEIYLAAKVSFKPESGGHNTAGITHVPPCVFLDFDPNRIMRIEGGTVFVMNDIGKTVARYDLGASMVPIEAIQPMAVSEAVTG